MNKMIQIFVFIQRAQELELSLGSIDIKLCYHLACVALSLFFHCLCERARGRLIIWWLSKSPNDDRKVQKFIECDSKAYDGKIREKNKREMCVHFHLWDEGGMIPWVRQSI